VTLTSSTGERQTVNVEKMDDASDTPQALNFNFLGIVITLQGYEGPPAVKATGPAIASALNGHTIQTATSGVGGGGASGLTTFVINPGAHGLVTIQINRTQTATLGAGEGFFLSQLLANEAAVDTVAKTQDLIVSLDVAIQQLVDERGRIGGQTNKVQSYLDYVLNAREQLEVSISRIADSDVAEQVVTHVRTSTLQDLRATVAREAAQFGKNALSLIRGSVLS
jgi:flagellin